MTDNSKAHKGAVKAGQRVYDDVMREVHEKFDPIKAKHDAWYAAGERLARRKYEQAEMAARQVYLETRAAAGDELRDTLESLRAELATLTAPLEAWLRKQEHAAKRLQAEVETEYLRGREQGVFDRTMATTLVTDHSDDELRRILARLPHGQMSIHESA